MTKVRLDKWLWSVRLFKTRTLAADACREGKVRLDGETLKPSYMLSTGQTITVKKNGFNLTYKVVELIEKRVGAAIAVNCYTDLTPEEEKLKFEMWYLASTQFEFREKGAGRPTKKERRDIDDFKGD